jgi:hypothetical protein
MLHTATDSSRRSEQHPTARLDPEHCALAASSRWTGGLESSDRIFQQPVQHVVIMRRIVMERNDSLRTYLGRKLESVPVAAVPPSNAACIFLVRVLCVVNQQNRP